VWERVDAQPETAIRSRSATVELTSASTAQRVLPAEFSSFLIYRIKKNSKGRHILMVPRNKRRKKNIGFLLCGIFLPVYTRRRSVFSDPPRGAILVDRGIYLY